METVHHFTDTLFILTIVYQIYLDFEKKKKSSSHSFRDTFWPVTERGPVVESSGNSWERN